MKATASNPSIWKTRETSPRPLHPSSDNAPMPHTLADLIHRFVYLKLGLALVLVWVGIKMMLKVDIVYIPTTISLAVITPILTVSVVASLRATRGQDRHAIAAPENPPFRVATEEEMASVTSVWRRSADTSVGRR